jgi:hypothetical protein
MQTTGPGQATGIHSMVPIGTAAIDSGIVHTAVRIGPSPVVFPAIGEVHGVTAGVVAL